MISDRSPTGQSGAENEAGGLFFLGRRQWLATVAAGMAWPVRPQDPDAPEPGLAEVEARAREAGLGPFQVTRTKNYVAIGDATAKYRQEALNLCELVARDCLAYFKTRGFTEVAAPTGRLLVVILASEESFSKFLGIEREAAVAGIYDVATNRLTMFDYRKLAGPAQSKTLAARANTITLVHEATHQWTYNGGLLDRSADVPVAISEGLAMLAEERQPTGKATPGGINSGRVDGLKLALAKNTDWIPCERLLADDNLAGGNQGDDAARQLAYAENWLLVYHLMQKNRVAGFRTYLARLRTRKDATHRLNDATEHLGDLAKLDDELRVLANRLVGR